MLEVEQNIEYTNISLKELFAQLQEFKQASFSGSLYIKIDNNQSWIFFFRLGHLSLSGGSHSVKQWCRHLKLFCPNSNNAQFQSLALEKNLRQQYDILIKLLNQGSLERQQLAEAITHINIEILFDLIQFGQIGGSSLSSKVIPDDPNSKFISLLPLVEIAPILKQAVQTWQKWQNEGLETYSPNLFPIIKKPDILQAQNLSSTQKSIISLINGIQSLRDLAVERDLEIVSLTKSLLPLVELGAIDLSSVPIPRESNSSHSSKLGGNSSVSSSPEKDLLVACVDDSPVACQALEKIIRGQGYHFVGIQNGLHALPLFLKSKPNLIFLDLMMPITNGYEICAQIRRTPSLKNVPVIILTGRDGLVDRMRAKMVGSTDFLSKPVAAEEVLKVLEKYLINA